MPDNFPLITLLGSKEGIMNRNVTVVATIAIIIFAFCGTTRSEEQPVFKAIAAYDLGKVKQILEKTPNAANVRDEEKRTPLRYLAGIEKLTVGKMTPGFSGTMQADNSKVLEIAKVLVQKGADISARDANDSTALNWAITTRKDDLALFLIEKGADAKTPITDKSDLEGVTPLHFAAGFGNTAILRSLLQKGALVNARSKSGITPLHAAALGAHPDAVQLLIENGADITAKDANGQTPLGAALAGNHPDQKKIAEILSSHGGK